MGSIIYLAGGCFWGMERLYRSLPGVVNVTAGYANGVSAEKANYEAVCSGVTGFRETKHLFLLQCRHQKWFFMDKNGFTVGSPEEFRAFFSEKVS